MGAAFIAGDVGAYIAPDDYPEGDDVLIFLMHFFNQVISRKASVEDAWCHAAKYDQASKMFVMYTSERVLSCR